MSRKIPVQGVCGHCETIFLYVNKRPRKWCDNCKDLSWSIRNPAEKKISECIGCGAAFTNRRGPNRFCSGCDTVQFRNRLSVLKKRARDKGLAYDLDLAYLQELFIESNGLCQLTGIPFYSEFNQDFKGPHPFAMSVDKIIPALGYTKGNVRLIIMQMNTALGENGTDLFDKIVAAYLEHKS